ncbi:MAG: M3 family oligoendopeptidase [Saprospiraceae bacterium]|nr:M3 family oligoendopeptidase [Saprospiraceae bacterium]MDW8483595.1 M3 family oligoendopeptidase [Saprospiraceae bacterium]
MTSADPLTLTFENFTYARPDIQSLTEEFNTLLSSFEQASDGETQLAVLERINALRRHFSSMYNICYVRHTADTRDPFYDAENQYFDQTLPAFEALNDRLYRALLASPFREALQQRFGAHLFTLVELALQSFTPEIISELQQENALCSEYTRLKATALIEFEGCTYNLSSLTPIEQSNDRDTRRRASAARWAFFAKHSERFDDIFDRLVRLRHTIAKKLGAPNFISVGYARMRRSDYNPEMVAAFRRQIREYIVPIATQLYERQQRRLGIERLYYYDEDYLFPSGNPKPKGNAQELVNSASQMYRELSAETHAFFQRMLRAHLLDLVNRDGKATGGYCTYIPAYEAPFIFSNFSGASSDVDVLTHEAGHAFQVWMSRHHDMVEYHWPTSEAAEIHSMSMEFFAWPWMHLFFGEDAEKYRFMHLNNAIRFLPYAAAVDEFQHIIYENPELSPQERKEVWQRLERAYLPHRDYDDNVFLRAGGFWQKQSHIYNMPFYYIDYALAQICAFQFWKRSREDAAGAWADYVRLCRAGGSLSFLDLLRLANLRSPFEDGCIQSILGEVQRYLDAVDDTAW